jgi:hypothetical protein
LQITGSGGHGVHDRGLEQLAHEAKRVLSRASREQPGVIGTVTW